MSQEVQQLQERNWSSGAAVLQRVHNDLQVSAHMHHCALQSDASCHGVVSGTVSYFH